MSRPPSGSMVWYRPANSPTGTQYRFGYCTYLNDPDLIRMGAYNGDTMGGRVVSAFETEWKEYHR